MQLALGTRVVARSPAPAAPRSDMGARVEVPYTRAIASYWRPAVVVEGLDAAGLPALYYEVDLDAPVAAGEYLLVFRTGDAEPPDEEVFYPLVVT